MLNKFLKEVVVIVAGKQAEEIAELLNNNKHVNEFIIAKKLGITINQTRNILYKLSDYGLVSFIRKKDKRKGWYTYFWKIEILKCLEFLRDFLIKRINQINYQIKGRETKRFYVCKRCDIEFNEENALLHNFICNECGDIFVIKDSTKVLKELNRNLEKLKKELGFVEEEIKKEREKIEKKKLGEFKKEEKALAKKKAEKKLKANLLKKTKKISKGKKTKILRKKIKKKSIKKVIKKMKGKKSKIPILSKFPKKIKLKKKIKKR